MTFVVIWCYINGIELNYYFTENADFIAKCPQNKIFQRKGLSIQILQITKQVLVDDTLNLNEEHLHLYFENEGGNVEDVVLNEAERSAVITFQDHQGSLLKLDFEYPCLNVQYSNN